MMRPTIGLSFLMFIFDTPRTENEIFEGGYFVVPN